MQSVSRIALAVLVSIVTCFGAFSLVGCGGGSTSAASAAASSEAASASAAAVESASADAASADDAEEEDQDNCYGDDLPARNS